MANKNRIAYAICSAHGIDTTGMSPKEAWEKAKEVADKNELADLTQDSPKEIKTFEETLKDADSFAWGDFSRKDAEKALKKGSITVYSSYPIKQGVFVSTSKIQSEEYAGGKGKKIYSMEIPLDKVAWISGDEGQFADIEQYKGD